MRGISRWIALGLFASFPTVASADVISDEESQCRSKNEGDACSIGDEAGSCVTSTCARNDYSEGVPPKTKSVECLICKVGEAPKPVEVEPPAEPAPEGDAKAESKADTKAESKGPEAKPAKSGGCSTGRPGPLGLSLFLLGASLWVRRRQSNSPTP